jgi:hypothetical protein
MSREELIKSTIENLNQLSDARIHEVLDYVCFLTSKIDNVSLLEGIKTAAANSQTYSFLDDEENLYQRSDLKEVYN